MTIKCLRFWTDYDNGQDYVEITNTSCMTETGIPLSTTPLRIKDVRPPEGGQGPTYDRMRQVWAAIEPGYNAWKSGQELPETGTPLSAWSGVNADEIAVLQRFDIRTIEGLTELPEAVIPKVPLPRLRQKIGLAKSFLSGVTATDAAKREAELLERIAALEAAADAPAKRGPGRPRKEQTEAA